MHTHTHWCGSLGSWAVARCSSSLHHSEQRQRPAVNWRGVPPTVAFFVLLNQCGARPTENLSHLLQSILGYCALSTATLHTVLYGWARAFDAAQYRFWLPPTFLVVLILPLAVLLGRLALFVPCAAQRLGQIRRGWERSRNIRFTLPDDERCNGLEDVTNLWGAGREEICWTRALRAWAREFKRRSPVATENMNDLETLAVHWRLLSKVWRGVSDCFYQINPFLSREIWPVE